MIGKQACRDFEAIVGREFFTTRPEDLVLYGSDASNNPQYRSDAVIRPANVHQVADVVKAARKHKIPVIPRGAGSGMTGGALPVQGGVMVVMTRFNHILEIDGANLIATVEPGVVTAHFQAAVEKVGLFYPPDPASREFSTMGGNAAENAGGTRAVKYGVTRDYILGLTAVIGTGEIIKTGVRTAKGVVGYDLTRMLVGSEGTLGIITSITVRLLPMPEARETLIAHFTDLRQAAVTVAALTAAKIIPATMEFMDRGSIDCARKYLVGNQGPEVGALLLIETDGTPNQAREEAELATRICLETGALSARRAESLEESESMWKARRALGPLMNLTATGKFNEDIVVPRSKIPEMIERQDEISKKYHFPIISFGHAGDGNIHVNVMFDRDSAEETERAHRAVHEIFEVCLELGGTISGEHGIGTSKQPYIDLEISPESRSLHHRIKAAFDPDGIMNPGKIFRP